ncbi:MAG: HD-GYP domain-containing protein [Lachnospiraceae bacterium]|nr:HD-GYP domain-containing protein [Lachnospiraceae bacterium]
MGFEHSKLQIGCLIIVLYIGFIYYRESWRVQKKHKPMLFDGLLLLATGSLLLDGATAYTVNHLEQVPPLLNQVLHLFFLISIDSVIFFMFLYVLSITEGLPKREGGRILLYSPFVVNVLVVVLNIQSLEYRQGAITNYSMGISAYTCFVMAAIYIIFSIIIFFRRWNYIERHKRASIFTYLLVLAVVTGYQMIEPEVLLTAVATTIMVLGAYMNEADPARKELSHYHSEMVMGFATLIENKDDNTGGHVRRTTIYAKMLAEELRNRGYYKDVLTKDYIKNLAKAAPMHDIGKIAVPDVILQKPGKLTDEEFAEMKQHTVSGGKIIQDTFGRLNDTQYRDMAFQVARHHHEKWNGKGYPDQLQKEEIPLCARIMAIADVFDAVSEKRCYRDAMPLEQCFSIIEGGRGTDFEPLLVDVFLDIREKVEETYYTNRQKDESMLK